MLLRTWLALALGIASLGGAWKAASAQAPKVGAPPPPHPVAMLNNPAPAISLQDTANTGYSLRAQESKTVLLEGSNARCPPVDHAPPRGPRVASPQGIQSQGPVWFAVVPRNVQARRALGITQPALPMAVPLADRQKKQPVRLPDTPVPGCLIRYVE